MVGSCRAPQVPRGPGGSAHIGSTIPLFMFWYCVLLCRIQSGGRRGFRYPETTRIRPRLDAFHLFVSQILRVSSSLDAGFTMSWPHTDTESLVSLSVEGWRMILGRCEGRRHAQPTTPLPRHPSFGCVGIGGASLSLRSGSNVCSSPLVSEAHRGEARGQYWPRALLLIL